MHDCIIMYMQSVINMGLISYMPLTNNTGPPSTPAVDQMEYSVVEGIAFSGGYIIVIDNIP